MKKIKTYYHSLIRWLNYLLGKFNSLFRIKNKLLRATVLLFVYVGFFHCIVAISAYIVNQMLKDIGYG